ncbi:kinase-like domain-containing protein [Mycena olivaceomarginata]|nr:kinase-like domain-containing protein [Mycena olivaceomarginata]
MAKCRRHPFRLWTQILEYGSLYGKLFTVLGTIYVYRKPGEYDLHCSKTYDDPEGDVLRTTAVIISSKETPRVPASIAARLLASIREQSMLQSFVSWFAEKRLQFALVLQMVWGTPGIGIRMQTGHVLFYPTGPESIFPTVFTERLGSGASGTVFRSADGRHVVKVFKNIQTAHHEATLLKMCLSDPHLHTPRFRGLYSNSRDFAVVMSYAGTPLPDIFSAADIQRREIVTILKLLHRNGIHHHDVRAENLMVNHDGAITLVDFDRAVKVDGECRHCPDVEMVEALQERMVAPECMSAGGEMRMEALSDEESKIIPYEP